MNSVVLTNRTERLRLADCILAWVPYLTDGVETHVLLFLVQKTLPFGKVGEYLKLSDLKKGIPGRKIPGLRCFERTTIYKARKRLCKSGLITEDRLRESDKRSLFLINIPAIGAIIRKSDGKMPADIEKALRKVEDFFNEAGGLPSSVVPLFN